jgi:glutamine synthetase
MDARFNALKEVSKHRPKFSENIKKVKFADSFCKRVLTKKILKEALPKEIYANLLDAMEGRDKIKLEYADSIALAMKEWAISHGATHYTHWFQPLTGSTAEKHDAFIDMGGPDGIVEKFSGKQLVQGEPDASSFPSGGLRSTYEARGYTGWDPSSPVFLWRGGDGLTLCIPSVFFSWNGDVLDQKIPLLRSDEKINAAVLRLLRLTGIQAERVFCTLGIEQEYFVVDRGLRDLRPDLIIQGRTLFGAPPPKGQELQDHYFGSVKDRILNFMQDFETAAAEIGIPLKTRHNEVAPAQHEVAQLFEKGSLAVDHNILLMEIMRQIAVKHDLACLLHEKPFNDLNGSGKHSNWSLMTDTGINLLDPTDTPQNNFHFLVLLTAILRAVHRHSKLLRASIGSAANDCRLGGHEAPPAIISVYLGEALERLLDEIEQQGGSTSQQSKHNYDLGLPPMPNLTRDNTDRNRTSPFAFTGNKFEFRAVGSSSNPAFPATVLNVIVAEVLNEMMDEIEANYKGNSSSALMEAAIPVLRDYLRGSRGIRYSGDNYSHDWVLEAGKRGLPNITKSIDSFTALTQENTIKAFKDVLTEDELSSRCEILFETYCLEINIQVNLAIEMFRTQILPAALKQQKIMSEAIILSRQAIGHIEGANYSSKQLYDFVVLIEHGIQACNMLEEARKRSQSQPLQKKAHALCYEVLPQYEKLRHYADSLEARIDDELWPLPKYREILFLT